MIFDNEPILHQDYPDPDVIRVNDVFYMISTTMHFMPGAVILRSYNLIDWEIASYVYDKLDSTPGQKLEDGVGIYGKGMWAASLRYHNALFYVTFVCNDTGKTYLYTSNDIYGPWNKSEIEGFYHDCSLYFEEEKVYIIYGNRYVYIQELEPDLSGPKKDGLYKLLVSDEGNSNLGYEGSHFYKINNKYYIFFIHSLKDRWIRTESCFVSDSLDGNFKGGDIYIHENGYRGSGIAQGGIVDDINGNYFAVLFQDRGAQGRIPYVLPTLINGEKVEILKEGVSPYDSKPDYKYEPLYTSDFLDAEGKLKLQWQWNHEPEFNLVSFDKLNNSMSVKTNKTCLDLCQAVNMLTQRVTEYKSEMTVNIDASGMKDGDIAGVSAFMGAYSYIGIEKQNGELFITVKGKDINKSGDDIWKCQAPLEEYNRISLTSNIAKLKVAFVSVEDDCDYAEFYYVEENEYKLLGSRHKLSFRLDHFCGCRFGLFYYSTIEAGGTVHFANPEYLLN